MKTARYLIALSLAIGLPWALQRWDRRRLRPEQEARAWNGASWGAALYAFGVFSMLGWCWVTRRGLRGLALGVASTVALSVALFLLDHAVAVALGIPVDPLRMMFE